MPSIQFGAAWQPWNAGGGSPAGFIESRTQPEAQELIIEHLFLLSRVRGN